MAFSYPCFKIGSLTRIDANTIDVHDLVIFLDEDADGKCDRRIKQDFRITNPNGLNTKAKIAAQIKQHVQNVITAAPWTPPAVENIISTSIGITLAVSDLSTVSDPDSDPTAFDSIVN